MRRNRYRARAFGGPQILSRGHVLMRTGHCIDFLTQICATQAAPDMVALGLLDGHARHCLIGGHGGPKDPNKRVAELMGAVVRLLAR